MEARLMGKVAVVTGAGQGIGKAIAQRLAREGADVVVAEYNAESTAAAAAEIHVFGRRALAHPVDVADVGAVRQMVDAVVARYGRIDILVNNAGVTQTKPLMDVTEEDWNRVVDVNQRGLFFCLQAAADRMIKQASVEMKTGGRAERSHGKIVNLASISGRRGRPLAVHYAASKAAVISITQSAALALAPYNINVNAVSPGVVQTPMWEQIDQDRGRLLGLGPGESIAQFVETIPLKRAARPEDIVGAVAFLCSPEADYITGQTQRRGGAGASGYSGRVRRQGLHGCFWTLSRVASRARRDRDALSLTLIGAQHARLRNDRGWGSYICVLRRRRCGCAASPRGSTGGR